MQKNPSEETRGNNYRKEGGEIQTGKTKIFQYLEILV